MNSSLTALLTKLSWQQNELSLQLKTVEKDIVGIKQNLDELVQKINHYSAPPLIINPEMEINKLNFITQKHEQKENLLIQLKNGHSLENQLKDKIQRVKTEVKMLQKYLDREANLEQQQMNKVQEHSIEEWVLQRRT